MKKLDRQVKWERPRENHGQRPSDGKMKIVA